MTDNVQGPRRLGRRRRHGCTARASLRCLEPGDRGTAQLLLRRRPSARFSPNTYRGTSFGWRRPSRDLSRRLGG